jgi:hypothetical protein
VAKSGLAMLYQALPLKINIVGAVSLILEYFQIFQIEHGHLNSSYVIELNQNISRDRHVFNSFFPKNETLTKLALFSKLSILQKFRSYIE